MKTEEQCLAKLEVVVDELNKLVETMTEEEKDSSHSEKGNQIAFLYGSMTALGYVLDAEEALAELQRKITVASKIGALKGVL